MAGQIPRTLSYQGILSDASGNPRPTGAYSFTFRLYDVSAGGTAVWSEVQSLEVKIGLFSAVLGGVTPFPSALKFNHQYWLGIQVAPDAEMTPRTPLTSVGSSFSAILADVAGTVADSSITQSKIASGQLVKSINDLHDQIILKGANGASVTNSGDTITITASGGGGGGIGSVQNTDNALAITNPAGPSTTINLQSPLVIPGSLGIGGTPSWPLHVKKSDNTGSGLQARVTNTSTTSNSFAAFSLEANNGSVVSQTVCDGLGTSLLGGPGSYFGTYSYHPIAFVTGNTEWMRIATGGYVGIGTTNPQSRLHVNGDVMIDATDPVIFTGAGFSEQNRYLSLINSPYVRSASGLKAGGVLVSDEYSFANPGKNDLIVKGKIGIGNNSPYFQLDVTGAIRASGVAANDVIAETDAGTNSWARMVMKTPEQEWALGTSRSYNGNQIYLSDDTYGAARLTIQPNGGQINFPTGNVSVGATNPISARLFATSATESPTIYADNQGSNSSNSVGVFGLSAVSQGVWGFGVNGVLGTSNVSNGYGVYGIAPSGHAIQGNSTGGYAGYFVGDVRVVGNLSKTAGSFKIDHPLDPANKYLNHSFVESPDRMNVYNGNIITDATGFATVELPSYFDALNVDYRYQLTVIGQFAQAIVSKEIDQNRFEIRTDKPNVKVSWQVTGVRNDAYARAHPMLVEEEKPASERGKYLIPQLFGEPAEKGIEYDPRNLPKLPVKSRVAEGDEKEHK